MIIITALNEGILFTEGMGNILTIPIGKVLVIYNRYGPSAGGNDPRITSRCPVLRRNKRQKKRT